MESVVKEKLYKSLRPIAIIQLCIVFSLLAWICSQPYMGELLSIKTKMLLLQEVMGISKDPATEAASKDRLVRNAERFSNSSDAQKSAILERYYKLQEASQDSFLLKFKRMLTILLFEISRFELLWIVLGIAVPVLLLLHRDGARQAAWLLFLLTLIFAVDNQLTGFPAAVSEDDKLFPSEEYLIKNYFKNPLSAEILEQYQQMKQAWKTYLIHEWTGESPSPDPSVYDEQVEKGEYAFNRARAEKMSAALYPPGTFRMQKTTLVLLIYLAWNFYFAWTVNKQRHVALNV